MAFSPRDSNPRPVSSPSGCRVSGERVGTFRRSRGAKPPREFESLKACYQSSRFCLPKQRRLFRAFENNIALSRKDWPPSGFVAVRRPDYCVFRGIKQVNFCLFFTEIKYAQKGRGERI